MKATEYKGCLSFEQTEMAWNKQKKGIPCKVVAITLNVDVATLYRSYQHYGFKSPCYKYKKRNATAKNTATKA